MPGTPLLEPDKERQQRARERLKHSAVCLGVSERKVVREAIAAVAQHRGWTLHAISVRTNHVHVVVGAPETPEQSRGRCVDWRRDGR